MLIFHNFLCFLCRFLPFTRAKLLPKILKKREKLGFFSSRKETACPACLYDAGEIYEAAPGEIFDLYCRRYPSPDSKHDFIVIKCPCCHKKFYFFEQI